MKEKIPKPIQQNLFTVPAENLCRSKFISTYRVSLIKDRQLPFESCRLNNSAQAQPLIKSLIETHGQSDREQFCVLMLNAKNEIIGLNIVSTGDVSSATVTPRELMKPAILTNSSALILGHNHPSGDVSPSQDDIAVTRRIIHASKIMGIIVHEHLIISMFDDQYFSFADQGIIKRISDEIG